MTSHQLIVSGDTPLFNETVLESKYFEALRQCNASQPVCTLPPEILAIIFGKLRDITSYSYSSILRDRAEQERPEWWHRRQWIAVSHVCHYFRMVALGHADLWSNIASGEECDVWTLELLERSKDAGLTLHLRLSPFLPSYQGPNLQQLIEQLKEPRNLCRMKDIAIFHHPPSPTTFCHGLFAHPAPLLERLKVCSQSDEGNNAVALPPSCFRSHAPRLREVCLYEISFYWTSFAFPSLIRLELHQGRVLSDVSSRANGATQPNTLTLAGEFAECLRGLPSLRYLRLLKVLPAIPAVANGLITSIPLPNLNELNIDGPISSCLWLLSSLEISSPIHKIDIRLRVDAEPVGSLNLSGLWQFLSSYAPRLIVDGPINELVVDFKTNTLRVDIFPCSATSGKGSTMTEDEHHPFISIDYPHIFIRFLSLPSEGSFVDRFSFVHTLLQELPLSDPKLFRFFVKSSLAQLADFLDNDFWHKFYNACGPARGIWVDGAAVVALLPFLAARNPPHWKLPTPVEPRRALFPTLKRLLVGGIGLSELDATLNHYIDDDVHVSIDDESPENVRKLQVRHVAFVYACLASRIGEPEVCLLEYLKLVVNKSWHESYYMDSEYGELLRSVTKTFEPAVYR